MKRKRFSDEQVIAILREHEAGGADRLLAGAATPRLAARLLTTEIGIVHLDAAIEALVGNGEAHGLDEFHLDLPGGRLRHAEPAAQFNRGDALLVVSDTLVELNSVPAVNEVWRWQALHW